MTDLTRTVVGDQRYYPFGFTRLASGSMYTDKLFTGQREMAGLGIYHYQSRIYSPKLGRFLSADSIVPNPFNPQDFNRFSYVRNNPVRYIDPSGHICVQNGNSLDEFAIPGNCNGQPDPKYDRNPLLVPLGWTRKGEPKISGGGGPLGCASGGRGCGNNGDEEGGVDIFVPVSDISEPDIFVPVIEVGGPDINVPVVDLGGPDIFVPVSDISEPDIFVPVEPEDTGGLLTEDPKDVLMPGGTPVGTQEGSDPRIRTVQSEEELVEILNALTVDATPFSSSSYPGQLYRLPDGCVIGCRVSQEFGPTLDINIPGIPIDKIHLPG